MQRIHLVTGRQKNDQFDWLIIVCQWSWANDGNKGGMSADKFQIVCRWYVYGWIEFVRKHMTFFAVIVARQVEKVRVTPSS